MIQYLIDSMVELRFEGFMAGLPDPMLGVDRHGLVRFVNGQAERLFGCPRADLMGRPADSLLHDPATAPPGSSLAHWHDRLSDPHANVAGIELVACRLDGTEVPVEVTLSMVGTQEGLWVVAAIRDVTDRKRGEEALRASEEAIRAARDAALETSRLKSQFLANMSHEIRTPMNGVLGLAHLLLDTELTPLQRRYMVALRDSGLSLLTILNEILDFSKVEAGKLELEAVDFDLPDLVQAVAALLASSVREKRLFLRVDIAPGTPRRVRGDPGRLRQILTNLGGNAVKFTDTGGVTLAVGPSPAGGSSTIRFVVLDTGVGIEPGAKAHLFDPFTQADASTTRRFGGTGLGLAICHQLINLMGGQFDFDSEPGKGSRFWFDVELPPSSQPATTAPVPKVRSRPRVANAARALVVDDSEINRLVARDMLESLGYGVDVARNGAEAVEAAAQGYDLILMDCLMPVMDGYEATARIRKVERRHTPIVAITASVLPGDRERCLAAGMDEYLSKPLDPEELASIAERFQDAGSRAV